jgi:hypothetical protein
MQFDFDKFDIVDQVNSKKLKFDIDNPVKIVSTPDFNVIIENCKEEKFKEKFCVKIQDRYAEREVYKHYPIKKDDLINKLKNICRNYTKESYIIINTSNEESFNGIRL